SAVDGGRAAGGGDVPDVERRSMRDEHLTVAADESRWRAEQTAGLADLRANRSVAERDDEKPVLPLADGRSAFVTDTQPVSIERQAGAGALDRAGVEVPDRELAIDRHRALAGAGDGHRRAARGNAPDHRRGEAGGAPLGKHRD